MKIEVSNGELVDKVSILAVKLKRMKDLEKLKNVKKEYDVLFENMVKIGFNEKSEKYIDLINVNEKIWDIEDKIRANEQKGEFDSEFVELARGVYFNNDKRAEIKRDVNLSTSSLFLEEKEYVEYKQK